MRAGDLRGRSVLEVGSGTGVLAQALAERAGARVWGVDASAEMLAVARARAPGVTFRHAEAERLPFEPEAFERAVARLVVHVVDRPRAFGELRRVLRPDGRLVVATFDPTHMHGYWLNRFFPSMLAADLARFPPGATLERELRDAGFASARSSRHGQKATMSRATALERIRGRHISTFDLIGEEELEAGLRRAEAELPEQVGYRLEWLVVVAGA